MESKVSARELMDVVLDTNKKVSKIAKKQDKIDNNGKPYSRFSEFVTVVLSLIGVVLAVSIFLPEILEMLNMSFSEFTLKLVYIGYAVLTILVATMTRIKETLRTVAIFLAVTPLICYTLMGIK